MQFFNHFNISHVSFISAVAYVQFSMEFCISGPTCKISTTTYQSILKHSGRGVIIFCVC